MVVDPVFVPAVSPQPPPSARNAPPLTQAPIAPPIAKSPVVKMARSRSAPPSVVPVHSSSATPQAPKPPSKARPVRSRSPPTKVKPPPPEARQLSAEAKRRAYEAFEERKRPVHVETDNTGKPLPAGNRVPVGAGLTAAAPSDPNPPGDGDDDQGKPSTPRSLKQSPRRKTPDRPPSQHSASGLPYKTPPGSLTGRSASWERDPSRHPVAAPPRPVTPKRKPPNPYPYPYGKPANVPSVPHDTAWASQAASSAAAPPVLDNSWWASTAASGANTQEELPSGGRLAPHRPPSGSPPSDTPRSVQPTTRYQPNQLPRLFGQQLADPLTLIPAQAGLFEVGLDWHKVLDTMLSPVRTPTNILTDRLKQLESLPARITIISFTGAGDRYESTIREIDAFRDQCRAAGCQLGGGIYLTNEKTGRGGKAELISRLRIRAFMDDRADICAEIRRTGCFAMGFDAPDYPQETSGALQVLTDYIWSRLAHWDTHHPLQAFVLQQYSGQGGRGGRRRR